MGNTIDMNELEPVARPLLPIFFVLDTSGSMAENISASGYVPYNGNANGAYGLSNSDNLYYLNDNKSTSQSSMIQFHFWAFFPFMTYIKVYNAMMNETVGAIMPSAPRLSGKCLLKMQTSGILSAMAPNVQLTMVHTVFCIPLMYPFRMNTSVTAI